MTTRDEIMALMLPLAPALLQGDADALQTLELQASDRPFRGLALLGPAQATAGGALPLVLLVQKSSLRGWEVNEGTNLVLAAFDPDTGALQVAPALVDPKDVEFPPPDLARPPRPPASAERTVMTRAYHFDAARQLALPPTSGPLVMYALAYDWVSNGVPVLRTGGAPQPAAAGPGAAAGAGVAIEPPPATAAGRLPSYEPTRHHPPLPENGVTFKFEPLRGGGQAILGSYAKPATATERLAVPQAVATGSGPRQVVAVVHVALALVAHDSTRPTIAHWQVPVYGAAPVAVGQRISGQFAIDLGAWAAAPGAAPRSAYLFIGERLAGPQPLATPAP